MVETKLTIINKLGLHARAAAKFVSTASAFSAKVEAEVDGRSVDGKSIMAVMMLAATKGSDITIRCDGADEQKALNAITDIINNRFDEGE
ncbi:phosphotransferase system HPr (HPr) family protein [Spongiibacter sp. IMCC21906]|jgi:phosphocarrier protein HPr|uniref:HPr family phosphocarrier protein n=1 Tax=Spongiibacter sp. IMCC21906 TaxID=1620392 RepID=UPI00062DEB75|nr:HPr family phosphocarrier protein [Spongiibacter sp. IMCC21906]AKH68855.1 phosphotransferase system HPr (HPr) family protein [Spongiibacter sp. IMCC21906]